MFENGSMVKIIDGPQCENIGYIMGQPDLINGRTGFVVYTEEAAYGQWLESNQIIPVEYDAEKAKAICEKRQLYTDYRGYIPANRDPYKYFTEMAEIGKGYNKQNHVKNGFRVWVETDEGPIPHVHVVFNNKGLNTSYIKLGKAEYLNGHKNKSHIMNGQECRELQKFFSTEVEVNNQKLTLWEHAVNEWNAGILFDKAKLKAFDEAFETDDNGNKIMPDYGDGIGDPT